MKIEFHIQFKRDLNRCRKAGWSMDLFENFLKVVLEDTWPLPRHYRAHLLQGNLKGVWDVHLRHNWVIFFQKKETVITLLRTGTHAYLGIG